MNRAFTEITGYSTFEVLGRNPRLLKSGAQTREVYQELWRSILAGRVWHGEMTNRRKDGSLYREEMTITPVLDALGAVRYFIGMKQDVTSRKQAELDLSRSEARYRGLANSLPEIVAETDETGRITFANTNAMQVLGYSPEDVQAGLSVSEITAPQDRGRAMRDFAEILHGRGALTGEYDLIRKSGTTFPVFVSASAIKDGGNTSGMRAIAVDITEQRRREKILRLTQFSVDRAADAVFWAEPDGRLFFANDTACRLLGYSREELLMMTVWDFDANMTPETWTEHWRMLRQTKTVRMESRVRRKDGSTFPVAIAAHYLEFDGKECGFAFVQDISARKQAEAALAEQKRLFDILMEYVPDFIYFKDCESRFTRISTAQAKHLGLEDPATAMGKTDFDFFGGSYARQTHEIEQEIIRSGQPIVEKLEREIWPDGRECWVSTSRMPIPDPLGRIMGTFGISRDITSNKLAEEALRASEEFNKRILESSSDGVCVLDVHGAFLYVSAGGRKLLELGESDAIRELRWLSLWEGADKSKAEEAFKKALAGGIGAHQGSLRSTNGTSRFWDVVISPIADARGAVERLVCVFRDISERHVLEIQLAQAQKLESIGQLAAGIAHEINTPIQYIGDNANFLEEAFRDFIAATQPESAGPRAPDIPVDLDYLRREIPKAIAQLSEGVQHVGRIVHAMKEFSHPGSIDKAPVDLNRAIESTILVSRNEWKYVADLTTDLDPDLPKVPGWAGDLKQVILNLIVNAAHAIAEVVEHSGRKGAIHIASRKNGDWVEIAVSDTGAGIPEAIQAKIYDPFFTTKAVGRGTGQGLAIAHSVIVRKHGGRISFETAPGAGTTFFIQLPAECEADKL